MEKAKVFKALSKAKQVLEQKGYRVFAVVLQGSQNYELDLYTEAYSSDVDCKAFVFPTFEDVYTGNKTSKTYQVSDPETGLEQVEVKDLRLLPELVGKGNPSYLELLATDYVLTSYKTEWEKLRTFLTPLLETRTMLFANATYGMAKEKEKALCHPYPATAHKVEQFGYDPKQLHHIVRLRMMLEATAATGFSTLALVPQEKEYLLELKKGVLSLEEAKELTEVEVAKLKVLKETVTQTPTSEVLYELESVVRAFVKSAVAAEFAFVPQGTSAIGYKGPLHGLPTPVRQFVKENHPEVNEKHMVEVLEHRKYELFNFWEK